MQTDIAKQDAQGLIQGDNLQALDAFTARLNEAPPKEEIQTNAAANNSLYLPVSFVQMKLDELFLGLWSWEVKGVQVVANEILIFGDLAIFHPIAKTWITRSGTGAAMIQQVQGAPVNDVSAKIKNTMGKDFPHAEAEAMKSAAKKFGKVFGRDLNRKWFDLYESEYFAPEQPPINVDELELLIKECKTVAALKALYGKDERYAQFAELFTARRNELTK